MSADIIVLRACGFCGRSVSSGEHVPEMNCRTGEMRYFCVRCILERYESVNAFMVAGTVLEGFFDGVPT